MLFVSIHGDPDYDYPHYIGFATTQDVYEQAYEQLFNALDRVEPHLQTHRYLAGKKITEADWRLFTTLVRFDAVYVGHFKCNKKRIADDPNLQGYLKELYQIEGIAPTVDFYHIKRHYYSAIAELTRLKLYRKGRNWICYPHTTGR